MNVEHYRQLLLAEQRETEKRLGRLVNNVRNSGDDVPHDTGDDSATEELRDEEVSQANAARNHLNEVRDALERIASGSYENCAEDGDPIEAARLEAVPWA